MDKFGIIALDIDGTIKGDSKEISPKTKEVLSRCKNLGAILVLATGRSYRSTQQIVSQLDNLDYVISFQGAQINKIGNDEILWNQFLPKTVVPEVLNFFSKFNTEKVAYVNDDIYDDYDEYDIYDDYDDDYHDYGDDYDHYDDDYDSHPIP